MLLALDRVDGGLAKPPSLRCTLASQLSPRLAGPGRPSGQQGLHVEGGGVGVTGACLRPNSSGKPPSEHSVPARNFTAEGAAPPSRPVAMTASAWLNALLKSPNLEWSEYRPEGVSRAASRAGRFTPPNVAGFRPRTSVASSSLAVAPAKDEVVPLPM